MASSALLALLVLQFGYGQSSLKRLHEDHYIDQQHNPEHDLNILLGDEDYEEIQTLSPAEQRKQLMKIVKRIDTEADNLLSAEEITLWIQHVYRKYALDDAEERFPEFDTDKDGVVTWEEYNKVAHDQLISFDDSAAPEDPEQESLRHLHLKEKRRFDFADVDGTPGLNVKEFLAFTHPSEVDHMADFAIEDVLSEYDTDKDGLISLSEFIGDVRGDDDSPSHWEIEETVRFKDLYDQDKDDKLNRDEQLRWVAPNSYGSAREEALHLIKEMDNDGDGQISEAEVFKYQELFMNSEVTDYGRLLNVLHDEL
ncbi:reticulocalbin-2 [Cottoperca gobio]|uniref:Reticulocalbin-3 n=1 Tax=Cottoperca gobio TaxID=56716 RepID=A0A6J2PZ92_COTGO|nr:reticulocalbin-2 [Cottoperca gobio]XP_029290667.1 reticulocalbin-2 [Cottoperca gobio]XP_029290668.1 reticulocalbin-2 [Cottoperca gobio]XP_029290669.1 reticulocalbin-2 [Cottoperca gobio]